MSQVADIGRHLVEMKQVQKRSFTQVPNQLLLSLLSAALPTCTFYESPRNITQKVASASKFFPSSSLGQVTVASEFLRFSAHSLDLFPEFLRTPRRFYEFSFVLWHTQKCSLQFNSLFSGKVLSSHLWLFLLSTELGIGCFVRRRAEFVSYLLPHVVGLPLQNKAEYIVLKSQDSNLGPSSSQLITLTTAQIVH